MTDYIALLRGVNVGGVTIRSAELADVFRSLGYDKVRTVLASGNVAFSETAGAHSVTNRIERALSVKFGYEARIVLLTRDQLAAIADAFPFVDDDAGWNPYVVFGSDPAVLDQLMSDAAAVDTADDRLVANSEVIYWHNRRAVGVQSAFGKLTPKARYRSTTVRNLRTLRKLLAT